MPGNEQLQISPPPNERISQMIAILKSEEEGGGADDRA